RSVPAAASGARSRCRPQIDDGRADAKRAAHRMKRTPSFDQAARLRVGAIGRRRLQALVDRQDDEQRVGPVGEDDESADQPAPVPRGPERRESAQRRNHRETRLHGEPARIAPLPLGEHGAVVESEARGLLRHADIDRRAREGGGGHQRQGCGDADHHRSVECPEKPRTTRRRTVELDFGLGLMLRFHASVVTTEPTGRARPSPRWNNADMNERSPSDGYVFVPAKSVDEARLIEFTAAVWPELTPGPRAERFWWRRSSPDSAVAAMHAPTGAMAGLCGGRRTEWI